MRGETIGWAVKQLHDVQIVRRKGWNGKGMFLVLIKDWEHEHDYDHQTLPFVAMKTADDKLVPWLCSQTDLLAIDWELAV